MVPRREGPFCYQDRPERQDAGASEPRGTMTWSAQARKASWEGQPERGRALCRGEGAGFARLTLVTLKFGESQETLNRISENASHAQQHVREPATAAGGTSLRNIRHRSRAVGRHSQQQWLFFQRKAMPTAREGVFSGGRGKTLTVLGPLLV